MYFRVRFPLHALVHWQFLRRRATEKKTDFFGTSMAQTTVKWAQQAHGTNPQNLIEYIVRQKIYDAVYWKQHCFGLSAETLVDRAVEINSVGAMYGEPRRPTDFVCLLLKLLQIAPDRDIVLEFIRQDEFKYLRVLGAFYLRLVGRPADVHRYLEPLLNDYRRIRARNPDGAFSLLSIDELIDQLLEDEYVFNIAMPRLTARAALETTGQLPGRTSLMQKEFDERKPEIEKEILAQLRKEGVYAYADVGKKERERWKLPTKKDVRDDKLKGSGKKMKRRRGEDTEDERVTEPSRSKNAESMTVEETNALRASLGLPPLK